MSGANERPACGRWGRLLLRLYPAHFRALYGEELLQLLDRELAESRREHGRLRHLGAAVALTADVVLAGVLERLRLRRRPVRRLISGGSMDRLRQDLLYGVRLVVRSPGTAAAAIATLALAIGVGTAIFTVVDRVLLRPLPFPEPDRLAVVWGADVRTGQGFWWTSYLDFVDFESGSSSFSELAAFRTQKINHSGPEGEPRKLQAAQVTSDLFALLGVEAQVGRTFIEEEDRPGAEPVVLLGDRLWRNRFAARTDLVGETIEIDGRPHAVVGVLPAGFDFPSRSDLWLPVVPEVWEDSRGMHRLLVVGRLAAGRSLDEADAELRRLAAQLEREYKSSNHQRSAWVQPLREALVGDTRRPLLVLLGAVGFLLLIACTNVANLLLARGAARRQEMAVRATLGAGRLRLVRQLLSESMLLSLVGGLLGALIGHLTLGVLLAITPAELPRAGEVGLDLRILGVMLGVSLGVGLLFGLFPALSSSGQDLQSTLRSAGRSRTLGGARHRLQGSLVVAEVALSVVLVTGAGLLLRSFDKLTSVDPGFEPQGVMLVHLGLPEERYPTWQQGVAFYERLLERLEMLPGARSVAAGYAHPLDPSWETSFQIEGVLEAPEGERPEARMRPVTADYFRTFGIPILAGRAFDERDAAGGPGTVIINETFARTVFPDRDPLGHRLLRSAWWEGVPTSFEIVGVVADVKFDGLAVEPGLATYFPHSQVPFYEMYVAVRADGDPLALADRVRAAIWDLDPKLPVDRLTTMSSLGAEAVAGPRFNAQLLGLFAVLALALSAVGLYGLLSCAVVQRTSEIGLRRALGARPERVVRSVLGQGLLLTGAGLLLGLSGAFALSRLLSGLLFEIEATDPLAFLLVVPVLTVVSILACAIPARRAVRVDPVEALRVE